MRSSRSHGGHYEKNYRLGCDVVLLGRNVTTFQSNLQLATPGQTMEDLRFSRQRYWGLSPLAYYALPTAKQSLALMALKTLYKSVFAFYIK
jgi:hypothetical protein